jgi:leucyl aminopeptidase (aminopeptidase T)
MRQDEKTTEKGRRRESERNKEKARGIVPVTEKRWRNKVNWSLGARESKRAAKEEKISKLKREEEKIIPTCFLKKWGLPLG